MEDPTCYNFSNEKRGIALLINNEIFFRSSGYKDRPGDDIDHQRMKKIFKSLGFTVYSYRDLTKKEMLEKAKKVANEKDVHNKSDCFVCVVGSHGEERQITTDVHSQSLNREHCILGVDGKALQTSKLIEIFNDVSCEGLKGKPKFFFIQACRIRLYPGAHEGMDKGINMSVTSKIGMKEKKKKNKEEVDSKADGPEFSSGGESEIDSDDSEVSDEFTDTSDTDDDEDFIEFKRKSGEEAVNSTTAKMTSFERKGNRRKRIDELDAKGLITEEKSVDIENQPEKSQPTQVVSDSHNGDNQSLFGKLEPALSTSETTLTTDSVPPGSTSNNLQDSKSTAAKVTPQAKKIQVNKKMKPSKGAVPLVTIVPCPEDMLIMFASLSGNFAVRGYSRGGWLLATLYKVLKCHTKDLDKFQDTSFLEVLTEVLTEMSKETFQPNKTSSKAHLGGNFSPGCFTHCLGNNVYFRKKPSKRKWYLFGKK